MTFPINFYKLRCTHPAVQVTLSQKLTDSHVKITILSKCRIPRSLCFLHFKLDYPACNMAAPLRGPYQYGDSPCRPHLTQGQTPGPWDRTVQME